MLVTQARLASTHYIFNMKWFFNCTVVSMSDTVLRPGQPTFGIFGNSCPLASTGEETRLILSLVNTDQIKQWNYDDTPLSLVNTDEKKPMKLWWHTFKASLRWYSSRAISMATAGGISGIEQYKANLQVMIRCCTRNKSQLTKRAEPYTDAQAEHLLHIRIQSLNYEYLQKNHTHIDTL